MLACVSFRLGSGLLLVITTLVEAIDFTGRPTQLPKQFPNPSSFKKIPSRRLGADEGKPERWFLEAEEEGHRFEYEFAGESVAEQILDIDKDHVVEGISCRGLHSKKHPTDIVMWLRWNRTFMTDNTSQAREPLKPGDVIAGSSGWRCGSKSNAGFIKQVVFVRSHATKHDPTTELVMRDVSPLHVFKDVYIDFKWMPPADKAGFPGRALGEIGGGAELGWFDFNYVSSEEVPKYGPGAKRVLNMGPLLCENCYAYLKPAVTFKLATDGFWPKEISMRFDVDMEVNIDVTKNHNATVETVGFGQDPAHKVVTNGWEKINNERGEDFRHTLLGNLVGVAVSGQWAPITIPLFHLLATAINLEGYPIKEIFGKIGNGLQELISFEHMTAKFAMKPEETYFEAGWKDDRGFYTDYGFNVRREVSISGMDDLKQMFFGLRFCAGLALTVGYTKEPLTTLSLCPETVIYTDEFTNAMAIPGVVGKTDNSPDRQLCITFKSFETDLNLDDGWLDWFQDDPYAQACFQGKCVQTKRSVRFSGNKVTWNEEQCIDVKYSHAFGDNAQPIAFVVKESDFGGFHEQYTQQLLMVLPPMCEAECDMVFQQCEDNGIANASSEACLRIPPSLQGYGKDVNLAVKFRFTDCAKLGGNSYVDNYQNTFTVAQDGCSVQFDYEGELLEGTLNGNTLIISSSKWSKGAVYPDGDVKFADGGTWEKTAFFNQTRPDTGAAINCGVGQHFVATQLGLVGKWSGFTYPSFFGHGKGDEVLAPVESPVSRTKNADIECFTMAPYLVSSTCSMSLKLLLMFVMFAAFASRTY